MNKTLNDRTLIWSLKIRSLWIQLLFLLRGRFDEHVPDQQRAFHRNRRILFNTGSNFMARGVSFVSALITIPLALNYLGMERYGLWAAITSVFMWISFFDFGVVNGLVNCIAEAYGRDDREAASRYVSTAFFLLCGIGAVCALLFCVVVPWVNWTTVFSSGALLSEKQMRWCVLAGVLPVFLGMPLTIIRQVYDGYQRAMIGNAFLMLESTATLGAMLLAIGLHVSMPLFIATLGSVKIVVGLINLYYLTYREMPWLRLRPARFQRSAVRRLARTSVPLFLFQLGAMMVTQSQLIILAHRCDYRLVADYSVLSKLVSNLSGLIRMATSAFIPTFRESFERRDFDWLVRNFKRVLRLRLVMAGVMSGALVLGGNVILRVLLRRTDVQFGVEVWALQALVLTVASRLTAHLDLLTILDRIWIQVGLVLINGVCVIAATWWLAPQYGVLGTILGLGSFTLTVQVWLIPRLTAPILKKAARLAV